MSEDIYSDDDYKAIEDKPEASRSGREKEMLKNRKPKKREPASDQDDKDDELVRKVLKDRRDDRRQYSKQDEAGSTTDKDKERK